MADVNGSWLGTYWQREVPTRFQATLIQGGNTLSGRILDDGYLGEAEAQGEVIGRGVRFIKRYLTSSSTAIHYTGLLSEDGNSMQGEWRIGSVESGSWEAHRQEDDLTNELSRLLVKEKELAGTGVP